MNIALFGTVFVDIKGFAVQSIYDPIGRNVGDVKFIHGGVGRNIAENLGVLGVPVIFGSTLDDSAMGNDIIVRLNKHGINTTYLRKVPSAGMGMWLAILNKQGDLVGSISKMPNLDLFTQLIVDCGEQIIANASHVALEIDLDETIAKKVINIAEKLHKPIYGIPGNLEVTRRHKEFLGKLECFICNDIEAAKLMAQPFDVKDVEGGKCKLTEFAAALNMKMMVITMGERGAIYYERGKAAEYLPVKPVEMLDSTGAGDSFFSGVVASLVNGASLGEAVKYGAKVAAFTIQSAESTCVGFKADC